MMIIERIKESDLQAFAILYQQLQPTNYSLQTMLETLPIVGEDSNHIVLGAKMEDKLVGSVLAVVCQMLFGECKTFMVVEDVVVDAEHRRIQLEGSN